MELSVEGEECRQCDNRTLGANMWKDAGGNEQKGVTEVTKKHLTLLVNPSRCPAGGGKGLG